MISHGHHRLRWHSFAAVAASTSRARVHRRRKHGTQMVRTNDSFQARCERRMEEMRIHSWIGALLVALVAGGRGVAGEPQSERPSEAKPNIACRGFDAAPATPACCEPQGNCHFSGLGPVGGWNPYGGGLLHWWNPCCFPRYCGPNDYCRKPLPRVCWSGCPSSYTWGPPVSCCPHGNSPRDCNNPH
jgi:hypothetical protein